MIEQPKESRKGNSHEGTNVDGGDTSSSGEEENSAAGGNGDAALSVVPDLQEKLAAEKDKYLRLAAEFENFKRRSQRDQNDSMKFANESLLKNLLPVIDNLERAIKCGRDAGMKNALMDGVELTYKSFLETVEKAGVRQISSAGQSFDPTIHQAVAQVESDSMEPNMVVDEFQKGYLLHDRILRPAMVTVSKESSNTPE